MGLYDFLTTFYKNASSEQIKNLKRLEREADLPNVVKIFYSEANKELGDQICDIMKINRGKAKIGFWPNKEIKVLLEESVKGCYCFVLGSYHLNANIRHQELKAVIRACKSSGAEKVIAIVPFLGYSKQEK